MLIARCGFERLFIAGDGIYAMGDTNRQTGCLSDTGGKPKATLCFLSGTIGWVGVFGETGPTLETALGIPPVGLEDLRRLIRTPEFACAQYHYITWGDWRVS